MVVIMLAFTMAVLVSVPVIVSMAKNHKANKVRSKTAAADDQDDLRVGDLRRVNESCDRLENDGDAKSNQEDGVEEATKNLGTNPLLSSQSCIQ